LVAGTAASAGATVKKVVSPTINICEVAPGAFRFALNGTAVSFRGSCGKFTAKIGLNHVTEVSAPAMYRSLSSISVSPAAAEVSSSLRTDTVSVRLLAGRSATVKFANEKLVVVDSSPAPVPPGAPGDPAPANPAPGNPAPGGPVTTPDPPVTTAATGYIEVCKQVADDMVEGTFSFTITAGTSTTPIASATLTPVWDQNGSEVCTGGIVVPAGTVTVAEAPVAYGYGLVDVTAVPTTALLPLTVNLAAQTASFTVTAGLETTATFVDETLLNTFKVCKTLANDLGTANGNVGALAGTPIDYTVGWTFTPPLLPTAKPFTGSAEVTVVAPPYPTEVCQVVPAEIPAGSAVTVSEDGSVVAGAVANGPPPYVSVSNVSIVPNTFNDGTTATSTEAYFTEPNPLTDGYVDAVFTNVPMGGIEVCKDFNPPWYANGTNSATFTVTDGSFSTTFTLTPNGNGGGCSGEMAVPVGTATVDETTANEGNFYLESISTISASDPLGARLLTAGTTAAGYALPANPATVSVPYGGVGNTTEVTFTNGVDPTQLKICKQTTSAAVVGDTFTFYWEYTSWIGFVHSGDVNLTVTSVEPGIVCSDLLLSQFYFAGPPAVNPDGSVTPIYVYEAPNTYDDVAATAGTWSGTPGLGGKLLSSSASGTPNDGACVEFDPGAGINIVTFTNEIVLDTDTTA
jgi:hypothetical protein